MAYEHKIGSGSIFPQRTKAKDTDRDYSGSCRLECPNGVVADFWISGWVNEGKNGKYIGLRIDLKDNQTAGKLTQVDDDMLQKAEVGEYKPPKVSGVPDDDLDKEVPF